MYAISMLLKNQGSQGSRKPHDKDSIEFVVFAQNYKVPNTRETLISFLKNFLSRRTLLGPPRLLMFENVQIYYPEKLYFQGLVLFPYNILLKKQQKDQEDIIFFIVVG